ncbi:MAG: Asp-tRNA(Asn)/Glu-tRNA(Gln) amidotransferase subunit GatA [bacterium]|nr:Asp-tRNA(Asn)/Glu-tRNA(Gln) amidotransferase subunit GatA [bacterium]
MSQLWQLGAEEIARGVRGGELSAREVFESCLERTRAVEGDLGAYLELLAEQGRERADEIDQRRRAGEDVGPLAGVPVAIKDNISVAGRSLTCGSRILEGYVAAYSATAIERLEAAGAVILGRCNLDEYGMGSSCENSSFQLTHNPWRLDRVPGGSSGGPAAAVATGVPLALGTDTGGSIRQPAAFCGIVGLKPTYGRVSRYGLVAFASSTDQIGPLARNTRDAALALKVIAGADERDSTSARRPVADPLAEIDNGIAGRAVGVATEIDNRSLPAEARASWRQALARLERLGAELREVSIPALDAAIACYYVLCTSEASANLARFDGIRYGRRAAGTGSLGELYRASRSQGFGAEVKRRIMLGTFALSAGYYDAYYGRALAVRQALRRQLETAFETVDLLVTPTAPSGAFAIGERIDDPLSMYLMDIYTVPASLAGLPALSVPCGLDDDGMPLGLQLMARPFDEAAVLAAGRAFEQDLDWKVEPTAVAA